MNLSASRFTSLERRSLLQKLRLKSATERHSVRLTLTIAAPDFAYLPRIARKTLEAWAGSRLKPLVDELGRAGRPATAETQVSVTRSIAGPEEEADLRRRAHVFAHLVRFALAEQRLIAARERAAQSEQ